MNYNQVEREKLARERADLPIERGPLIWAVLGLVIAIIGIVVMRFNDWVGLAMILGGVISTTIITDRWHNEMSLRNMGKMLVWMDGVEGHLKEQEARVQQVELAIPEIPDTHPPR